MESSNIYVERGRSFLNLGRFKAAAEELEQAIVYEPYNLDALIMLCVCYINLQDNDRSKLYTDKLLALAPDLSIGHYYKSICADRDGNSKAAEGHIWDAINLDPRDADYWAKLSDIYSDRKEWDKALEYADKGLECDPENIASLNHRTQCLTKLNRMEELQTNINDTLSSDPYNAYTHSNVGWSKLEAGDYENAKKHFAEALRLNPNLENARAGMINAIKSRNFLFRWFLQYGFWMSNKKDWVQWAIMIGFVLGRRVIFSMATEYPVLYVVGGLMLFFTYLTWLINPVTNLFLLMDRFGRHVLSADEKKSAAIAGIGVFGSVICAGIAYSTGAYPFWYLTVYLASVAIPLCKYYDYRPERRSNALTLFTFGLAVIGFLAVVLAFADMGANASSVADVYLIGFVLYTWVGAALIKRI